MTSRNFITTSQDFEISSFLRLTIDDDLEILEQIDEKAMPMLFFLGQDISSSLWHEEFLRHVVEHHLSAAEKLKKRGFKRIVLAVDNDGLLMRMLSLRFSDWPLADRMKPVLEIFSRLVGLFDEVWVLLSIEELMPGGMDATDGVLVAQALEDLGLKTLIATSGTKDFLPLYQRKITKKKISQHEDFLSNEPGLSSALWVRQATTLKVWVLSDVDNAAQALTIARDIGLEGIIASSSGMLNTQV